MTTSLQILHNYLRDRGFIDSGCPAQQLFVPCSKEELWEKGVQIVEDRCSAMNPEIVNLNEQGGRRWT